MLSILIPTRDFDCCKLAMALQQQAQEQNLPYEIIIGEDGSSPQGLKLNEKIANLPGCSILSLEQNVGRSKIRNILADKAKGENIMFIDSDAIVEKELFLHTYMKALETDSVVCGGLYHADKLYDKNCTLRYKYEKNADKHRKAAERSKRPYDNFATFCFAIRRELFMKIKFDEEIRQYGYEDTLFGHKLQELGVTIKHIDNPLLHTGLESNAIYLSKVEESLKTLSAIQSKIGSTPLIRCYNKLRSMHLINSVSALWRNLKPLLRKNLLSKKPSLFILNIYKIGYFCNLNPQ